VGTIPDNSDTSSRKTPLRRLLARLEGLSTPKRRLVNVVFHEFLFSLSLLLAFLIRSDASLRDTGYNWNEALTDFLYLLPFFLIVKTLVFWNRRLFRGGWRYAGIRDVARILFACWIFVLIAFLARGIFLDLPRAAGRIPPPVLGGYFSHMPRGVMVLDFLATVFLACTARLGFRIYREELRPVSAEGLKRVLIVGAGNAAETVIREINRMPVERFRIVGMVDDDPAKRRISIHDIPVLGTTDEIREVCEQHDVEEIIIAMPSASRADLQRVVKLCEGTKLKFQSLPSVGDLIDGRVTVNQIRPVDINDLLGRDVVALDDQAIGSFLRNRTVLVTGAGGSIGSEMSRQICEYQPQWLVLLEQAETPLFDIHNELLRTFPDIPMVPVICDIADRDRVMQVWADHRPDVVIHAAAHKHVPLMELNPCEAVKNNILGSRNVADASCEYDVAEFVTISTDKAVNPSSVMGCSKRVSEIYTQSLNGRAGCRTQFKAVRFGNVLGSNGSVVPTFRRQIAAGGPVTVTHPDMTRYFMTIPEAAQLVLQAAATGTGGQIFLLDMGESVKIADLARQMITLSGFRPDEDIEIVYTGVRPGEKLFEELKTEGEDIEPTVHPKVMVWAHTPVAWDQVTAAMETFVSLQNSPDRQQIVQALRDLVPEYEPLNPPEKNTRSKTAP
jgi:FlaA1/EpsC-like NDP-sugar epimerase